MKKFMAALSTCILIYSLCACSTGAGSISTPTSEESPSPSSTALPESSEGPSSRGIAPDYKNSPYFLPVGSMEFTVIDNTAVPEFEGKEFALGVGHDFTSLEDKVLAQKEKMIKKNQVISGLIVSPDGKSNAYYLITYKIDKTTGETLEIILLHLVLQIICSLLLNLMDKPKSCTIESTVTLHLILQMN